MNNAVTTIEVESASSPSTETVEIITEKNILEKISVFLKRFIFFDNPAHYTLLALWVISTHLIACFDFTGYIFVHSAEPQSGKTRVLEILDSLVANSSGLLSSPTESVLFRTAKGHTQLLDEVDSWKNGEDMRSVLNAGFKSNGTVPRMDRTATGGYQDKYFSVFAPRALAGIGEKILDPTTRDRCFMIRMKRQTEEEKREKFTRGKQKEAVILKKEIEQWAKVNWDKVQGVYEADDFPYLDSFADRTIDIAQPLASIIEVVGENSPMLAQMRGELVSAISSTRKENQELSRDQSIMLKLAELAMAEDPLIGNASELAEKCKTLPDAPNEYYLASVLHKHGLSTKSTRKSGEKDPKKRYSITKDELVDLVARYVPQGLVTTEIQSATTIET